MESYSSERREGFIYTLEAVLAALIMLGAASYMFSAGPSPPPQEEQLMAQKAQDVLKALAREGTLSEGSNWSVMEYKINSTLGRELNFRLRVYNQSGLVYSSSSQLSSEQVFTGSIIVEGEKTEPREFVLAVWSK